MWGPVVLGHLPHEGNLSVVTHCGNVYDCCGSQKGAARHYRAKPSLVTQQAGGRQAKTPGGNEYSILVRALNKTLTGLANIVG